MFPLADDFNATSWSDLEPVATNLLERPIEDADDLESLFKDISDMAEHVSEAGAKLYIGMTCDTENEEKQSAFMSFVENVRPKMSEVSNKIDLKIAGLDFLYSNMHTVSINIRVHGYSWNSPFFTCSNYSNCNLSTVCN